MPREKPIPIQDQSVGDSWPIKIKTTIKSTAKNPTSARAVGYDPGWPTNGTATSDGTQKNYIIDADTTQVGAADDKWNGVPISVVCEASGEEYETRIVDWTLGSRTLEVEGSLPETVAAGDKYIIEGEPLMLLAAAAVSGNETTVETTGTMHAYAGERRLAVEFTFSGSEVKWQEFEYNVNP
jgi:hypothetical protein